MLLIFAYAGVKKLTILVPSSEVHVAQGRCSQLGGTGNETNTPL